MSELLGESDFDVLIKERTRLDADFINEPERQQHLQGQRYLEWLGETPSSEVVADFTAFLESRPYKENRTITDPEYPEYGQILKLDAPISPETDEIMAYDDEYFDTKRDEHFDASAPKYNKLSIDDLARQYAQTELDNDTTRQPELYDVLFKKLFQYIDRQKTKANPEGMSNDDQGALLDRVIEVMDQYKQSQQKPSSEQLQAFGTALNNLVEKRKAKDQYIDLELQPRTNKKTTLFDQDSIYQSTKQNQGVDDTTTVPIVTDPLKVDSNPLRSELAPIDDESITDPVTQEPGVTYVFDDNVHRVEAINDDNESDKEESDKKQGKRRRIAALIGGLAVIGIVAGLLASNCNTTSSPKSLKKTPSHMTTKPIKPSHVSTPTTIPSATPHTSTQPSNMSQASILGIGGTIHKEYLTPGDTIWYHVKQDIKAAGKLNTNSIKADQQIEGATQKVLNLNKISWAQARDLPIGYSFKI